MKKLKVITIVGTRPEIIRLSRIITKMDSYFEHTLIHTGQNYDYELNQIFFEDDAWAEDKESYKMDTMSKGISGTDTIDVMDRDKMVELIKFISNHEMGPNQYGQLKNIDKTINKALDRAYEYVLSDEYSLKEFIK